MGQISNPKVVAAIKSLCSANGTISPEMVVEAARSPKSPLHAHFTWDDTEAAEQYRLIEARTLLRVTVEYLPLPQREMVRAFVSLGSDRLAGDGYRVTASVLSDADLREQLLLDAHRDIQMFMKRYKRLKELTEVIAAMRAIDLRKLRQRG
jgi:hypothetical protein